MADPNFNDPNNDLYPPSSEPVTIHKLNWAKITAITIGILLILGLGFLAYFKLTIPDTTHKISTEFSQINKITKANNKIAKINIEEKATVIDELKGSADELEEIKPEKKLPKLPIPLLTLDLVTSKDTYLLYEPFEGQFTSKVKEGGSFPYLIFAFFEHGGIEKGTKYGSLFEENFTAGFSDPLYAFFMNETGYAWPKEKFSDPGEYTLTYLAYKVSDCSELNLSKIDCDLKVTKEDLKEFAPLATVSKTITVLPEEFDATIKNKDRYSALTLAIEAPKDHFQVGESFEANLSRTTGQGEGFRGIYTETLSHNDFEETKFKFSGYLVRNSTMNDKLKAFTIDDDTSILADSFNASGDYTYTIKAYRCADLGLPANGCDSEIPLSYLKGFTPLTTATKTITVTSDSPSNEEIPQKESPDINQTETHLSDCIQAQDENCMTPFLNEFTSNLTSCLPSMGETPIGFEPFMGLLRGYDIKGVTGNNCVIDFWFLDIPKEKMPAEGEAVPENLLNKKMTCTLTKNQLTIEVVGKWTGCEGPLKVELDKM